MRTEVKKPLTQAAAGLLVLLIAFGIWWSIDNEALPEGLVMSNGRIEAVEIDICAKTAGRLAEVYVNEGDFVSKQQVLAQLDTRVLQAQFSRAQAEHKRASIGVVTAKSVVEQRKSEHAAAKALVLQRQAESAVARKHVTRTEELTAKGTAAIQTRDDDRAAYQAAQAALAAAQAQVAAAQAAINRAESGVVAAGIAVEAAQALVNSIQAEIDDSILKAPRDGRIQYLVRHAGEVLSPGGVVMNVVDLSDVYMTFFLPTEAAGRVALEAEARLVLDAAPQYVIPASVSFVADVAQFTPKTVETTEERQKLMFRIKAKIDPDLLHEHLHQVKTGLPGVAYVRLDPNLAWPADLQPNVPAPDEF